jgi:soluble epoxide hydrolase/lipid-phosphate phosphatase
MALLLVVSGASSSGYRVGPLLFAFDNLIGLYLCCRLSVPFYPPAPEYIPMDEMVRRVPNFGYQKYLADPKSAAEIDQNVGTLII